MFSLLQASFWERLNHADQAAFKMVNTDFANSFFDVLMPFMRNAGNWAPLYVFVVAFALLNFRAKGGWWVAFLLVTVALTDMAGTHLFKLNFHRVRPCNDPTFQYQVRLLVDRCSSGYSFISNHAANHFGLATFFFITARPLFKSWAAIAFVWAGLISLAQIYVGVHYPLDVLAGTLLGVCIGLLTGAVFNKRYGFAIFDNQPTLSS